MAFCDRVVTILILPCFNQSISIGKKGTSSVNAKKKAKTSATNEKKPHAVWSKADEENLLKGLVEHQSRISERGNFRIAVFNEVAETLNPPASGGDKMGKGCKDEYGTVPDILFIFDSSNHFSDLQIKHDWEEVIKINHKSGWPPWDQQLGANIMPEHENN
uniref:Myb/SANT-like domain-containing protein n=1 Tax=Moniliophthora roreri TaxID=221103 RepID=A0A0W0ETQ6_MONRR